MTTITFKEELNIKKTHFNNIGEFLSTILEKYEELEDKALGQIAKEADIGDYTDKEDFFKILSK